MTQRTRDYLFYSATRALCGTCLRVVDAKEIIRGNRVLLWKRCPTHGVDEVLLSDDAAYYRLGREAFLKSPEQVEKYNTPFEHGCPYDCGICPDHEQHGCVSILEITDHCNLRCPTCYAGSGPERVTHRSLETIERMLDRIGPTLVCTAITADETFQRRLSDCTHVDRLNLGPIPTTKLDWLQPHEGNIIDFLYRSRALQVAAGSRAPLAAGAAR